MTAGRTNKNALSQHWGTPRAYVAAVREVLGNIALDPCSNEYSIVGADTEYRLPDQDGLMESWDYPTIYVNPPYGKDHERGTRIKDWLNRCREANREHGSEVLALVPVATNTSHWKDNVWGVATSIAFLYDTRLKFLENGQEGGKGAPMSCAMIYWGSQDTDAFKPVFSRFGAVVSVSDSRSRGSARSSRSTAQGRLFGVC